MGQQGHRGDCKRELSDTKAGGGNAIGIGNPDDADASRKIVTMNSLRIIFAAAFVTAFATVAQRVPA
jgi:hypothetical protein